MNPCHLSRMNYNYFQTNTISYHLESPTFFRYTFFQWNVITISAALSLEDWKRPMEQVYSETNNTLYTETFILKKITMHSNMTLKCSHICGLKCYFNIMTLREREYLGSFIFSMKHCIINILRCNYWTIADLFGIMFFPLFPIEVIRKEWPG